MVDEIKNEEEQSVLGQLLADEAASATDDKGKTAPDVDALARQLEYEKQRNDSLQGRIDSQLKPLNATVRELRQQIEQVKAVPARVELPAPVTVQDLLAELTPEEREKVGEPQLAILAKLIEKPTQAMVERVRSELQSSFDVRLRQMEGQLAGQTGKDLWDRVEQLSPGVRDRNDSDDPRWVEFLNGRDPVSGRSRKELGNAAVDVGDVTRLALLHDEFLRATGQSGEKKENEPNRELRPDGSRAEPAVSSSVKPTIRNDEIEKFYSDLAKGKYEGKPELVEKMETLITGAIQEGRVL